MDPNTPSPEELKAEQEAQAEVKVEELREKLAEKYGLDPVDHAELLDKLVADKIEDHKKLSTVIGTKINYRKAKEAAEAELAKHKPPAPAETNGLSREEAEKLADERFQVRMDERDLEATGLPKELTDEIKVLAKVKGISIKLAAKDPYIVSRKETLESESRAEEATITNKKQGGGKSSKFSQEVPPKVDMSTLEGRATWDEYLAFLKTKEEK